MDATTPWSAPVDADDYYREIPTLTIMRISGLLLVQEKTFPITAEKSMERLPPTKIPCCSTLSVEPIRQEYGAPVIRLSSIFLLQNTGDGFLCG